MTKLILSLLKIFLRFHRGIDFVTVKRGSWTRIMNDGRSGSSSLFLAELSIKEFTNAKVQKLTNSPIGNYVTQPPYFCIRHLWWYSTEFLLGYLYIKEAECLERLFLSSISMQREKIEKQFKETVQKHSNLINTTHKTSVPGWYYVVSQKALHLHPLGLHHAV